MIFDIIKYGTFTADDFLNAHNTNNFTKFTPLPIDLRKQFISEVIDLYPNKESKNFKQAAFDFIDGKITEKQFRAAWLKYWPRAAGARVAGVAAVAGVVSLTAMRMSPAAEYYRPYLEQHAKHLNKVIQEYQL